MADQPQQPEIDVVAWLQRERDIRKGKKKRPPPPLVDVLLFLHKDLAGLVDRLGSFASVRTFSERDLESAATLGQRLTRRGDLLHEQDASSWLSAAREAHGQPAWSKWASMLYSIGSTPSGPRKAGLVGDHLAEAGRALCLLPKLEGATTLAQACRNAAKHLLAAASLWTEVPTRKRAPVDWEDKKEPMIPSNNALLDEVKLILCAPESPTSSSRSEWTHYVADKLARFCSDESLRVYGRQWRPEARGEYLCDQVWCEIDEGHTFDSYRGVRLAMECEWDGSEDANLEDFCKVLDVSADRRLFIGNLESSEGWPNRGDFVDRLAQIVSNHRHLSKDDAVVVVLCEKGGDENIDSWILRPNRKPDHRGS